MINWFRTTIMNMVAASGVPGEEVISADFVPVALLPAVSKVRSALFEDNNRTKMNIRLRQLMEVVHSTDIAAVVEEQDSRITYWPSDNIELIAVSETDRPTGTLADVWIKLKDTVGIEDENVIFGENPVEPYLSLRNAWSKHPLAGYQLAAIFAAAALRTIES